MWRLDDWWICNEPTHRGQFRIPDEALFWFVMVAGFGAVIGGSVCIGVIIGHG